MKPTVCDTLCIGLPVDKINSASLNYESGSDQNISIWRKSFTHFGHYENWDNLNPDQLKYSLEPIKNSNRRKIFQWGLGSKIICNINASNKILVGNVTQKPIRFYYYGLNEDCNNCEKIYTKM